MCIFASDEKRKDMDKDNRILKMCFELNPLDYDSFMYIVKQNKTTTQYVLRLLDKCNLMLRLTKE